MVRNRRVGSISGELVRKSREAALTAVQVFNNPLVQCKSETYIVLMIIAWTYLLHSYYRRNGIDYRYYQQVGNRRIFDRTKDGRHKYWELERCLNDEHCPLDHDTTNNLRFLIRLHNEIEHQMAIGLDSYLSGRYQACALNYSHYIKELFGERYGLDQNLAFSIQFLQLSREQVEDVEVEDSVPERLKGFIMRFDSSLSSEELSNERYSYSLIFTRKLVNHPGQADRAIEFVDPHSDVGQTLQKQYVVKKEVERPKFRAKDIIQKIRSEGLPKFNSHHHTVLWKNTDGKNPSKGYGVHIAGTWYWYESWLTYVREHCRINANAYR